jgi:hypothetical protein
MTTRIIGLTDTPEKHAQYFKKLSSSSINETACMCAYIGNVVVLDYLLNSKELAHNADLFYQNQAIFRRAFERKRIHILEYLITNCNVVKTDQLDEFMKIKSPLDNNAHKEFYEQVDRIFYNHSLYHKLNDNLEPAHEDKKKLKV